MNPPTAIRGPQSLRSASLRTMPRFPQSDHTTQINYSGMLSIISDQDVAILRLKDEVKELTARIQGLEELGSGVIPEQIEVRNRT